MNDVISVCDVMIGESRDCEVIECVFWVWTCVARDQFTSCVVTFLRRA